MKRRKRRFSISKPLEFFTSEVYTNPKVKAMKKAFFLIILMLLCSPLQLLAKGTFFVRIMPDRETLYAGDSMLVSVVLYASSPIAKAECTTDFSVKGKCDVRKLNINRNATAGRTREGRNVYYTLVWSQYVVAPSKVGSYTIPTQRFKATLQQVVSIPDLFDQMMGATPKYREEKVECSSKPYVFEVKEKPLRSTQEMIRSGAGVL